MINLPLLPACVCVHVRVHAGVCLSVCVCVCVCICTSVWLSVTVSVLLVLCLWRTLTTALLIDDFKQMLQISRQLFIQRTLRMKTFSQVL